MKINMSGLFDKKVLKILFTTILYFSITYLFNTTLKFNIKVLSNVEFWLGLIFFASITSIVSEFFKLIIKNDFINFLISIFLMVFLDSVLQFEFISFRKGKQLFLGIIFFLLMITLQVLNGIQSYRASYKKGEQRAKQEAQNAFSVFENNLKSLSSKELYNNSRLVDSLLKNKDNEFSTLYLNSDLSEKYLLFLRDKINAEMKLRKKKSN